MRLKKGIDLQLVVLIAALMLLGLQAYLGFKSLAEQRELDKSEAELRTMMNSGPHAHW